MTGSTQAKNRKERLFLLAVFEAVGMPAPSQMARRGGAR